MTEGVPTESLENTDGQKEITAGDTLESRENTELQFRRLLLSEN